MTMRSMVPRYNSSLISAIRNLVCPLCGASMLEFRCLGLCRSDWRQEWEHAISAEPKRSERARA